VAAVLGGGFVGHGSTSDRDSCGQGYSGAAHFQPCLALTLVT
jgi:hypothetical protein